jgi:hypothetical protein
VQHITVSGCGDTRHGDSSSSWAGLAAMPGKFGGDRKSLDVPMHMMGPHVLK